MKNLLRTRPSLLPAALLLSLSLTACRATLPDYGRPLPVGSPALIPLGPGEARPDLRSTWVERDQLLAPLERSIAWTRTQHSQRFFPQAGISHELALASLEQFQEILMTSGSPSAFVSAIEDSFQWYQSAGWDGEGGGVLFTGYCTPILEGRLTESATHRYPLYALPPDLEKGKDGEILGQRTPYGLREYPTRQAIEASGILRGRGLELVWLTDPIDAYIAHVNGSAFIDIGDGSLFRLGYAGKNGRAYRSLGKQLIADEQIPAEHMNLASIRDWASENPHMVQRYLALNDSYVFFTPIEGNPRGSLNVEVEAERSLATDKTLFPRGAHVFVDTAIPHPDGGKRSFQKMMLDQDTGGAIRTAGRADIYLGQGPEAELRAGTTRAEGQMYYLFLRQ